MILQCTIVEEGVLLARPKDQRDALRAAMQAVGDTWDYRYKMLKFRDLAVRRYGLAPRRGEPGSGRAFKGSYAEAKLKRRANGQNVRSIGESKPFVWSGNSRERAQHNARVKATAASSTRGECQNIIDVPTLNLTPEGGRINLREEFERVTDDERAACEAEGLHRFQLELEKKPSKTTRIA